MAHRLPQPRASLTPDQFAARFQEGARVLWTLAAGVLGDPSEAEDVLQEAFLAALSKREQFDPDTSFLAWMGTFVRNVALNERRKRARRQTASTDPAALDESAPRNGERHAGLAADARGHGGDVRALLALDTAAFDDRMLAGLRELAPGARACLLLRVVVELDYAEIAAVLAIPEGTAMSHVHRSRAALRAWFEAEPAGVADKRSKELHR